MKETWWYYSIKWLLGYHSVFFTISGALYALGNSGEDKWVWFSRIALGLICFGFLGIIKAIEYNGISSKNNSERKIGRVV